MQIAGWIGGAEVVVDIYMIMVRILKCLNGLYKPSAGLQLQKRTGGRENAIKEQEEE